MNTLRRFADTVRFRGRGLIVDRAVSTAYNRTTRGGALVLAVLCPRADTQLKCLPLLFSGMSFCAREAHAEAKGRSVTVHDMCAEKPRRFVPKQEHVMAAWRGHEAVGVVSPTVRARPHRESCLFGDYVVDATHLVWLVVASIVCFCEHLRARCGVFSVQGSYFPQHVFEGLFCGSDARVRHGRDWFVSC